MKTLFSVLLALVVGIPVLQAQTPYYQGKTIRIVTGYPAGDVNDLWPRLIAQHMAKFIPGNPNFIIQNMPGASLKDPALKVEAEKRKYELEPVNGDELDRLAKEVMAQPPAVIERMKKVLGN